MRAHPFADGEAIFHADPRWLGADAALTVPLGADRTLWLFGDTFVATSQHHVRTESKMVRNTVAIQNGLNPSNAVMKFYWQHVADGGPASFFPEQGKFWYWPGHGVRLAEGPLVIFLFLMRRTGGDVLGFATTGYAVAVIDDPDVPVETWKPRITDVPLGQFDAVPATAIVRDGDYVVALAIRQHGTHAGTLVRYPATEIATGNIEHAQWWAGNNRGWVAQSDLGPEGPTFMIDDAGAECSLHWDGRTNSFIHVASYGFGASTIGIRTAPRLTGPWTKPITVYRPSESSGPRPFVYAAKAHPELQGENSNELLVTYATNSFEFGDLFTENGRRTLYWPRFVSVVIDERLHQN